MSPELGEARNLASSLVLWMLVSIVLLSFVERFVHRVLMHRRILPAVLYRSLAFLDDYQQAHAVLHHRTYYRRFDFEPDPVGREIDLRLGPYTAVRLYAGVFPMVLALAMVDLLGAAVFSVVAVAHMYSWGLIHREMHVPTSRILNRLTAYRFLARYHYLHHRYPRLNFNLLNPLADFLLGTVARPMPCDIREMLRLGYLKPRHPRTLQRLGRRKERVELPARSGCYLKMVRPRPQRRRKTRQVTPLNVRG